MVGPCSGTTFPAMPAAKGRACRLSTTACGDARHVSRDMCGRLTADCLPPCPHLAIRAHSAVKTAAPRKLLHFGLAFGTPNLTKRVDTSPVQGTTCAWWSTLYQTLQHRLRDMHARQRMHSGPHIDIKTHTGGS